MRPGTGGPAKPFSRQPLPPLSFPFPPVPAIQTLSHQSALAFPLHRRVAPRSSSADSLHIRVKQPESVTKSGVEKNLPPHPREATKAKGLKSNPPYKAHTPASPPKSHSPPTSPPPAPHPPSPARPPSHRYPHPSESSADNTPSQTYPPCSPPTYPSSSGQYSAVSPARK